MKLHDYIRNNMNLLKGIAIILSLTVIFFLFGNMDLLQEQTINMFQPNGSHVFLQTESEYKENSSIILKNTTSAPYMPQGFCTFKPLSPVDAKEERLLLDSIAWPETPLLPSPFSLNMTSDPAHSNFTILPGRSGGQWHVGDQLEVMIQIYDFQGNAKKSGGDFLIARLHNRTLEAGVAGRVVDHLNGSYSAVFTLLWEGRAQIEVTLVHPSEAITVLQRLTRQQPDRVFFKSIFRSGKVSEATVCNACLRQTNKPVCNFTDLRTGDPWFCYKPKKLRCDARVSHMKGGFKNGLKAKEEKLFQGKINMKVSIQASGPAYVTVLPPREGQLKFKQGSGKSGLSGYYYQGVWRPLDGARVHQFNNTFAISQCLKGKTVYLHGDSTIRQWYEYLSAALPDSKAVNLYGQKQRGPFMIWDNAKKILVTYRCHGPPLRFASVPTSQLHYIANELDDLVGGKNTVVVVGIWSHLSTFPLQLYIRRLQSIRRAVVRLLNRAPDTLVVIRTANLKEMNLYTTLTNSDWYSFQQDKVLRAVFKGLNVRIVDSWDMVLAHHLPNNLHPQPPIIKNMIDVLLSYVCPR